MEFLYCIECEKEVKFEKEGFHVFTSCAYVGMLELSFCDGPFTSCPPPITDDQYWEWLFLQEPDEEFVEISNRSLMY